MRLMLAKVMVVAGAVQMVCGLALVFLGATVAGELQEPRRRTS